MNSIGICGMAIALFLQIPLCYAQDFWQTLPDAPIADENGRFDDVFFIDGSTGWIVNVGDGRIYKTSAGGSSWTLQLDAQAAFGYHVGFRSIGFATPEIGWSGNLNLHNNPVPMRSLFETRDGGQTWSNISDRISGPDPAGICGLWVVNENLIYGVGRWNGPAIFIKSTDGGLTWTSLDMEPLATGLVDVYFFNPDSGIVVGGNGIGSSIEEQEASRAVVLFTEDGGNTWQTRYISETQGKNCWKISFPTSDIGYVATQGTTGDGVILKTTDAGRTWQENVVGDNLGFSGIGFVTPEIGWVGALETYETIDGGESWREVTHVGRRINRFRMVNSNLGFAVGETVYRFSMDPSTGIAENEVAVPSQHVLHQNYPNPFNPSTIISYSLAQTAAVRLAVYDLHGRLVATLLSQTFGPGTHKTVWNGTDHHGNSVASGVYLYSVSVGDFKAARKMLLIR